MLEKLKTLYGERMVGSDAVSKHDALWFQTDEGETFGVLKSAVTDREKESLYCLFRPFSEPHRPRLTDKAGERMARIFLLRCPPPKPGKHSADSRPFF
nr:hypothetical protein [Bacillus licheniformis]